jgi:hypothetical protein
MTPSIELLIIAPLELKSTLSFSKMSTNISFLSFLDLLITPPSFPYTDLFILLIGLVTAVEGAVALEKMFHFDCTLSLIFCFESTGG